ncbi:MAG: hypothetical protein U9N40_01085 [Euryarchaeota archaeon]|nr:hypothetical protein [Euryarchaeota archaeon]
MQIKETSDGTLHITGKVVTRLDQFVGTVTDIISQYTSYVIVSGYVAILFGRARGTEDIDLLINHMDKDTFSSLCLDLSAQGFYFLNSDNIDEIYSMLCDRLAVRIAKEEMVIPNIEIKFLKDDFDHYAINKRKTVTFEDIRFFISPIELQIPYKLYPGSDKDIEDAMYLWVVFKERLDNNLLRSFMECLHVNGELYGIEI